MKREISETTVTGDSVSEVELINEMYPGIWNGERHFAFCVNDILWIGFDFGLNLLLNILVEKVGLGFNINSIYIYLKVKTCFSSYHFGILPTRPENALIIYLGFFAKPRCTTNLYIHT